MTIEKAKEISEINSQYKKEVISKLNKELQTHAAKTMKENNWSYQEAVNDWLFNKIVSMAIKLEKSDSFIGLHTPLC